MINHAGEIAAKVLTIFTTGSCTDVTAQSRRFFALSDALEEDGVEPLQRELVYWTQVLHWQKREVEDSPSGSNLKGKQNPVSTVEFKRQVLWHIVQRKLIKSKSTSLK